MRTSSAMVKKLLAIILTVATAYFAYEQANPGAPQALPAESGDARIALAFENKRQAFQVSGTGRVVRILPDDRDGSRHQRFILSLESGQTLMIAHNIDLAPRIATLAVGDTVSFYGEYEWSARGGVIHWTHHDPQGRHVAGWLEHDGRRYQ
jgi:hypothetical protein